MKSDFKVFSFLFLLLISNVSCQSSAVNCDNGPPRGVLPQQCCNIVPVFDNSTIRNCLKVRASNARSGIRGDFDGMECFFQCLFNQTNSFTSGAVDMQGLKSAVAKTLNAGNQAQWIPTVNEAIDFCAAETAKNADRIKNSLKSNAVDNKTVCSPIPEFMGGCIYFYQIRKCPFPTKNPPKKCSELKAFYENCRTLPLHN